jgi:hypothetical protein
VAASLYLPVAVLLWQDKESEQETERGKQRHEQRSISLPDHGEETGKEKDPDKLR